jgi:4-hydroxybenzoate polyprenyltransferase
VKTLAAFFLFSLAAGVIYLINDIIDIKKDRLHPTKRLRPIASGKLGVREAWTAAFGIGIASFLLSFVLDVYFGIVVLAYFIFNLVYSKVLKEIVIVDVFCIGGFFLLRIIAGGCIADVAISQWIIFMTILLALFLGFNKRRQELALCKRRAYSCRHVLLKYDIYFIDQMISVITSSIVVVYMLYATDVNTVMKFGSNHLIYSIPFVYYGIFRYLFLIHKVHKDGDPTRILLSDRNLRINVFLWIAVCIAVIYGIF